MSTENFKEALSGLEEMTLNPELIQDNKLHFTFNEKLYRVRMPNQRELMDAERKKNEYQVFLLKQENTVTKKQLKKLLKEKDIDLDKMEEEINKFAEDLNREYLILAKTIDDDKDGIEKSKKKIQEIKNKKYELIEEMAFHTTPAIEVQAESHYLSYLTSVCTEENVSLEEETKWKKAWVSFDEYLEKGDSELSKFALGTITKLIFNIR